MPPARQGPRVQEIQFEIRVTPLLHGGLDQTSQVLLHARMRGVKRPADEAVRQQSGGDRPSAPVTQQPIRVLCSQSRPGMNGERPQPQARREARPSDALRQPLQRMGEALVAFRPVAPGRLETLVQLQHLQGELTGQ